MKTIICHPNFEYLGKELVEKNPEKFHLGKIYFDRFPDQTPNQSILDVKEYIEHKNVTYIGDFSDLSTTFEQYNALFNIVKNTADKLRIIMPFFPVGTSERVERKGETETAHSFAHLISGLPSGRKEKNSLHIFDIHALVEQSLFNIDKINTELHTATSLVDIADDQYIVFPDEGAAKRFKYVFPNVPQDRRIICDKKRGKGNKRTITIKEGNPKGKNLIIVDDLIQSGSTIGETAKLLKNKGAKSVKAFATHGVFPHDSHKKLAGVLDELIVTDSIPLNRDRAKQVPNMVVLSIRSLVEKILRIL